MTKRTSRAHALAEHFERDAEAAEMTVADAETDACKDPEGRAGDCEDELGGKDLNGLDGKSEDVCDVSVHVAREV